MGGIRRHQTNANSFISFRSYPVFFWRKEDNFYDQDFYSDYGETRLPNIGWKYYRVVIMSTRNIPLVFKKNEAGRNFGQ